MELKNYIQQSKLLSPTQVSVFLRTFHNVPSFTDAKIVSGKEGVIEKNIRSALNYDLTRKKNLTETNWHNLLVSLLANHANYFLKSKKINLNLSRVINITLLKYIKGGFYKKHHDNCKEHFREISAIVFLNNDYEGGHLQFFDPITQKMILDVKPEVGKVVIWPSNYLFPHQATEVTKGTRFTIVGWLI